MRKAQGQECADRGWRRPPMFGVCDFPKGLVGAGSAARQSQKRKSKRKSQNRVCVGAERVARTPVFGVRGPGGGETPNLNDGALPSDSEA
jgi:hypothetical protein